LIDGIISAGEWNKAFQALVLPNGVAYYLNDSSYLYILLDLVNDNFNDPPLPSSPWGDYFWMLFDVNENGVIDVNQDRGFATYPGTYTLCISYFLNTQGAFTGCNPSSSYLGAGFGPSVTSSSNHRTMEFALLLSEVVALPGDNVAIAVFYKSQNPAFTDSVPPDMWTSMASYAIIHLDTP
jgi:hypothetical protein